MDIANHGRAFVIVVNLPLQRPKLELRVLLDVGNPKDIVGEKRHDRDTYDERHDRQLSHIFD